jgi:hypothetical protein
MSPVFFTSGTPVRGVMQGAGQTKTASHDKTASSDLLLPVKGRVRRWARSAENYN